MAAPTREEFDKGLALNEERIRSQEARITSEIKLLGSTIEGRFAKMESDLNGRLMLIENQVKALPSTRTMLWAVAGAVVVVIGAWLGVMSFAGDRFDSGIGLSASTMEQTLEAQRLSQENANQIKTILEILNAGRSSP
jgi:hypothetical protein